MYARLLCCLVVAALAQPAAAQSFELERLQLDPSARGSLVLGSGEVGPWNSFRISAAGHWEHRPLVRVLANGDVLGRRDDDATEAIVDDRQTVQVMLDYVVLPRVEIYGRASYIVNQDGPGIGGSGDDEGWGMPSFGLRLGAAQQSAGAPLNVAIAAEFLPQWGSSNAAFARWSSRPAGLVRLEVGRNMGPAVLAVNAGYLFRDTLRIGQRTYGSEAQAGIVLAGTGIVRPEISFRGAMGVNGDEDPKSAELLAGLRLAAGPIELFGLGGPGFFDRPGTPQWRAIAGVALRSEPEKKAAEPQPAPPPPAPAPAPVAPAPVDPCAPGQAHTPEQCPALDDDGDGIPNGQDACPTEKGLAELKGCPAKDGDGDGVADHLDKCPTEAGAADNQGCPRVVVQRETRRVELREQVLFQTGKATIRPESTALLDEIANVLKAHPEIKRVQVEGHTDSTGGKALNQRLSQRRAAAVARALQDRGIDPSRLSSRGFGPAKPIASNDTVEGREQNRRVEIRITEQSE